MTNLFNNFLLLLSSFFLLTLQSNAANAKNYLTLENQIELSGEKVSIVPGRNIIKWSTDEDRLIVESWTDKKLPDGSTFRMYFNNLVDRTTGTIISTLEQENPHSHFYDPSLSMGIRRRGLRVYFYNTSTNESVCPSLILSNMHHIDRTFLTNDGIAVFSGQWGSSVFDTNKCQWKHKFLPYTRIIDISSDGKRIITKNVSTPYRERDLNSLEVLLSERLTDRKGIIQFHENQSVFLSTDNFQFFGSNSLPGAQLKISAIHDKPNWPVISFSDHSKKFVYGWNNYYFSTGPADGDTVAHFYIFDMNSLTSIFQIDRKYDETPSTGNYFQPNRNIIGSDGTKQFMAYFENHSRVLVSSKFHRKAELYDSDSKRLIAKFPSQSTLDILKKDHPNFSNNYFLTSLDQKKILFVWHHRLFQEIGVEAFDAKTGRSLGVSYIKRRQKNISYSLFNEKSGQIGGGSSSIAVLIHEKGQRSKLSIYKAY